MKNETNEKPSASDNLNSLVSCVLEKLGPHRGIIGIDESGFVFEGYDGKLSKADNEPEDWIDDDSEMATWFFEDQLSAEERHALADEMIRRWSNYKSNIS